MFTCFFQAAGSAHLTFDHVPKHASRSIRETYTNVYYVKRKLQGPKVRSASVCTEHFSRAVYTDHTNAQGPFIQKILSNDAVVRIPGKPPPLTSVSGVWLNRLPCWSPCVTDLRPPGSVTATINKLSGFDRRGQFQLQFRQPLILCRQDLFGWRTAGSSAKRE